MKDSTLSKWTAEIVKAYEEGKSALVIAKEYGTYPQKIYRILKASGAARRTHSEAQHMALDTGRSCPPTEGRQLTPEEKMKISESMAKHWKEMSNEKLEARKAKTRAAYFAMPDADRERLHKAASEGVLQASREGSKLERYLLDELAKSGYNIVFHKKGYILNPNLEIDLLIPSLRVAIEVDGIYHERDVWENGALVKVTSKDSEKNGLLLGAGYVVIRLANTVKTCTNPFMRERLQTLLSKLAEIKTSFPAEGNRLIYL